MAREGHWGQRFSFVQRSAWLEDVATGTSDLLVVGGGITGAGIAREAALRGLRVVLLERKDFASGTSSRSSKLIHGGLRYLAQGDVALVREAARERSTLRRIAPHLAEPLRMLLPAASRAGRAKLTAGVWTFEKLAGDGEDGGYRVLDRRTALAEEPLLREAAAGGGAVVFTEYATNDARLVLETLQSAAAAGAKVANYAAVTAVARDTDGIRATVEDIATGGSLVVRAKCIVNAAGPWFDSVNAMVDSVARPATQLTKGIHVVVAREKLPVSHLVVLRAHDGRSTFAVPSGDTVYLGTTDTLYDGDPDEPEITDEDVEYVLESVATTLGVELRRADLLGSWAGVRPLLKQDGKSPSEISRRDEIRIGPGPMVAIAGGKLTTYRRMAERVVDAVAEIVGIDGVSAGGRSAHEPLSGGSASDQARARDACRYSAEPVLADRLWKTYGVNAAALIERLSADAGAASLIGAMPDLTVGEVEHAITSEMAMTVDDVLRRRSRAAMFRTEGACGGASEVASVLAQVLGWDAATAERQADEFRASRGRELALVRADRKEGKP